MVVLNGTHAGPTKLPPRRVVADDFAVEQDGVTYYPHAGEWVDLRAGVSLGLVADSAALEGIDDLASLRAAEASGRLAHLYDALARSIRGWSWTDDAGDPYPNPPDAATLRYLSVAEQVWLLNACMDTTRKNVPSPSGAG